jgi:hypothetical protein
MISGTVFPTFLSFLTFWIISVTEDIAPSEPRGPRGTWLTAAAGWPVAQFRWSPYPASQGQVLGPRAT